MSNPHRGLLDMPDNHTLLRMAKSHGLLGNPEVREIQYEVTYPRHPELGNLLVEGTDLSLAIDMLEQESLAPKPTGEAEGLLYLEAHVPVKLVGPGTSKVQGLTVIRFYVGLYRFRRSEDMGYDCKRFPLGWLWATVEAQKIIGKTSATQKPVPAYGSEYNLTATFQ